MDKKFKKKRSFICVDISFVYRVIPDTLCSVLCCSVFVDRPPCYVTVSCGYTVCTGSRSPLLYSAFCLVFRILKPDACRRG